jgi:hypothetical protein
VSLDAFLVMLPFKHRLHYQRFSIEAPRAQ